MVITTFGEYVSKTNLIFNCNFQHRDLHVHLHRPQLLLRHRRRHGEKDGSNIISQTRLFTHFDFPFFPPPKNTCSTGTLTAGKRRRRSLLEARPLLKVEGAEEAVPLAELIRATKVREGNVLLVLCNFFFGGGCSAIYGANFKFKQKGTFFLGYYTFLKGSGIHGTNFKLSTRAKTFVTYSEYKTRFLKSSLKSELIFWHEFFYIFFCFFSGQRGRPLLQAVRCGGGEPGSHGTGGAEGGAGGSGIW